ncbi:MAG: hypothetical protein FJZ92_05605 [Chloroflexi bacterium]|nr:hypothetical protein [Chloroflexota bacterium]
MPQTLSREYAAALAAVPERARALLEGAIDAHVHASPDPYAARRTDSRQLVRMAVAAGMAGLVLKSHEYPTQPLAWALQEETPGFRVHGALSLDQANGGINPEAVEVSLRMGATVIWMPTFDSVMSRSRPMPGREFTTPPVPVVDDRGALLPAVHEVLDCIRRHDAVLASGHLSGDETLTLLRESRRRGIRSVITHASFWIPVEVQQEVARLGGHIEHCAIASTRPNGDEVTADIVQQVRAVGIEHVVLSTDLGQADHPDPPVGFGQWIERFLAAGFSAQDVGRMVRRNPGELLG